MSRSKIYLDHLYTNDKNHRFLKKLEKLGFKLEPQTRVHPGKHYCRFISFFDSKKIQLHYLEFVNVKEDGQLVLNPGLSMRLDSPLKPFYESIQRIKVKPKFIHRNYDWEKDSKSYLPGWNFLTFKKPGFKNPYTWFTEYEKPNNAPASTKRKELENHKNGAVKIVGIELELNPAGKAFFESILRTKLNKQNTPYIFPNGQSLWYKLAKKTALISVVIQIRSIDRFRKKYKVARTINWHGVDAIQVKNPNRMWDILLVE